MDPWNAIKMDGCVDVCMYMCVCACACVCVCMFVCMYLSYKSPSSHQILAELIEAGCITLNSVICILIHFIWNKEEFPQHWKGSAFVHNYKKVL
jgi:hypothetical protein